MVYRKKDSLVQDKEAFTDQEQEFESFVDEFHDEFLDDVSQEPEEEEEEDIPEEEEAENGEVIPLSGTELLAKIQSLGSSASVEEKAMICGYLKPNGEPDTDSLQEAILKAYGMQGSILKRKHRTRQIALTKTGAIIVPPSYTQQLGWQPKQKIHIRVEDNKLVICL